jgi:phosphotransferase system HPr (HPr) family protein
MNGQTLQRTVVVVNEEGLHVRPAAAIAERLAQFQSLVTLSRDDKVANGLSPLQMFGLLALPGSKLTVRAIGPDAAEALQAVIDVLVKWEVVAPEPVSHPPGSG